MLRTLARLVIAAFIGGMLSKRSLTAAGGSGHVPLDLYTDAHPDGSTRAEEHYRPDPHAEVEPEDRESFRPVTVPA